VIHRLATRSGSLNCDRQILLNLGLSNELRQTLRTQLEFKRRIVFDWRRRHQAFFEIRNVLQGNHAMAIVKRKVERSNAELEGGFPSHHLIVAKDYAITPARTHSITPTLAPRSLVSSIHAILRPNHVSTRTRWKRCEA